MVWWINVSINCKYYCATSSCTRCMFWQSMMATFHPVTSKGVEYFGSLLICSVIYFSPVSLGGSECCRRSWHVITLSFFSTLDESFVWAESIILPAGNVIESEGLWHLIYKRLIDVKMELCSLMIIAAIFCVSCVSFKVELMPHIIRYKKTCNLYRKWLYLNNRQNC